MVGKRRLSAAGERFPGWGQYHRRRMTTAEAEQLLLADLALWRKCWAVAPAGSVYSCTEDLLLRHGRFFRPQPLPVGYSRGPIGDCYRNAQKWAGLRGLRYVEGKALGILPVDHAWLVDEDNGVIEVTWDEPGAVYFGLCFSLAEACAALIKGGRFLDEPRVLNRPYGAWDR